MRGKILLVLILASTPATANITYCKFGATEYTFNDNFGSWTSDKGPNGDVASSGKGQWSFTDGGAIITVKRGKGAKATLSTAASGKTTSVNGTCSAGGTGRTPGE